MKSLIKLITLVIAFMLLIPDSVGAAGIDGVDDLRGRWDVDGISQGADQIPPLRIFINDIAPDPDIPNVFLASGCMLSLETEATTPMALRAKNNLDGTYEVVMISTVVPQPMFGEPFMIRFDGIVETFTEGVHDDTAVGTLSTQFGEGEWTAIHHDRRRTDCPPADAPGLFFGADIYVVRDNGDDPPSNGTIFEGFTNIVSSKMQVNLPDGSIVIAEPYTDHFSPHVDFVSSFRYVKVVEGIPSVGQPYTFSLLDILGEPIPGAEFIDIWFGCAQGAPTNLSAVYTFEENILLSWDSVPSVPGFDPEAGIGFYQIGVHLFEFESPSEYGAAGISSIMHIIPWANFAPGSPGTPDGENYGDSLEEFVDGTYQIDVIAFAESDSLNPGVGLACQVRNSSESMLLEKDGSIITLSGSAQ